MQKEIEVKAKVSDFEKLQSQLKSMGCIFSEPVKQDDSVFVNFETDYAELQLGANFLRIRREDKNGKKRALFTIKQPQANELDCIEKETEISNPEQLEEALVLIGYHKAISVCKTRTKTKYQDMEICLDEVDGLGSFIEVEKITDGNSDSIQDELFVFLESLGIKKEDRVTNGYDTLLYLAQNK